MRRHILISVFTGSLAVGAAAPLLQHAIAAPRTDRLAKEEHHWTDAERARDALDHLKKAHEQLDVIKHDRSDANVNDAIKEIDKASEHVDKFIADVDKTKK